MRHRHETQLRWSDADMLGHLNHARLLALVEDARMALLAQAPGGDVTGGRSARGVILARLEVDYLAQVRYRVDEVLPVESWVLRLGGKSLTLRQELSQDGAVVLRADAFCVMFDYDADASRPIAADERKFWDHYVEESS
ncbi:MAG: acyl-CoA thioesterase [Sporichthyaceae bacterium]